VGKAPSDRQREVFKIVSEARDLGVKTVQDAVSAGKPIAGWEVDHAVRGHIKQAKYGDYFIHRTGHSISDRSACEWREHG
jgi:Xaa-Pro dipeptidase